jgi:molecular chaperone HtpG
MEDKRYDRELAFEDTRLIKYLKNKNSEFLENIFLVLEEVKPIINGGTNRIFYNYTLHDINHSIRLMEYMYDLVEDINKLSDFEIVLMVYSALLHDIGMAFYNDSDIECIKNDNFIYSEIKYSAALEKYSNESLALQECIRRMHGKISGDYISSFLKKYLYIPSRRATIFDEEVASICQSHNEDFIWVKSSLKKHNEKGEFAFNSQYIAILLRIADIIDIDEKRTPPNLYILINPTGYGDDEWKQHFIISNEKKIKSDEKTHRKKIVLYGESKDAKIHRKILKYIEWINYELKNSIDICNDMESRYKLNFENPVENNIDTKGFTFSDFKLDVDFKAITRLLMGEKIYGKKSLGLREIIQNSIDACKLRKEMFSQDMKFGDEDYLPSIRMIIDEEKNTITIKDNGTGMSLKILKNYFLNIGVSYYTSDDFLLQGFNYKPIGNFGIGFLACFMLSDNVTVKTRFYKDKFRYDIELEKESEYICLTQSEDVTFHGTEIILNYSQFVNALGNNKLETTLSFLRTYFITEDIKFEVFSTKDSSKESVINNIFFEGHLQKNVYVIDVSKYLIDVEGYVLLEKKNNFIREVNDINYSGRAFYFNGEELKELDDLSEFKLKVLYNSYSIEYIEIPIIDPEISDDFDMAVELLESFDDAVNKFDNKLEWISVFVDTNLQDEIYERDLEDLGNNTIVSTLTFRELLEFGHYSSRNSKMYVRKAVLFPDNGLDLFLPFKESINLSEYYWTGTSRDTKVKIFVRNVLVELLSVKIPNVMDVFTIKEIKINLKNNKIIPNVSRNDFDESNKAVLNYAIGKAIHQGALDEFDFNENEKNTIKMFINTFYNDMNYLLQS